MQEASFEKYLRESEPEKRDKGCAWYTAIGLQVVDGLEASKYLIKIAKRNIEGEISIEQAGELIDRYYEENPKLKDRTEEADKVSARIAQILLEKAFVFSPTYYLAIHGRLFEGIYSHAGKFRDYNITKKEWILGGDTVLYGGASELKAALVYDFGIERAFSYKGLSMEQMIEHLAVFVSGLWQIHVFAKGNTQATAVFFIKYLRTLGFDVTNDIFAENAWYFRNALVRANYNYLKAGIHKTREYLELFLRNLLLNEKNELCNRYMHISETFEVAQKQYIEMQKQNIEAQKQDIRMQKQNIDTLDGFESRLQSAGFSRRTLNNAEMIYRRYGTAVFGRGDVINVLGITQSPASALLMKLLSADLIEPVKGMGKGKYRFK